MRNIRLIGWRDGLEKVALTQLVREFCGLGLADAKHAVDRLLDGEPVELVVAERRAAAFLDAARAFGAVAESPTAPR